MEVNALIFYTLKYHLPFTHKLGLDLSSDEEFSTVSKEFTFLIELQLKTIRSVACLVVLINKLY